MNESRRQAEGVSVLARWRLRALVAMLALLGACGGAFYGVVWAYERELEAIGRAIVDNYNEEDTEPLSEMGPEAWVEIETTVAFEYLFYGTKTGKITLIIHPYPHAPEQELGGISYIFAHRDGTWVEEMSYHEEF